ncbi:MAG: molybdenum cofactor guanylyltransferase MobA [Burkholderiaceae bacterium]|jgi:molybdopterin-guanine dinucleotide biosynthesis protein A
MDSYRIERHDVTGLILAGGRGSRMGGVDKGLQNHKGAPLALHALMRLAPQVGQVIINANRNLGAYEALEVPVVPDSTPDFAGPLAGMLTGLENCETPWMATVPCDSPGFPLDLVERLAAAAVRQNALVAMATAPEADGQRRPQPVFCLLHTSTVESLTAFLHGGGRKIDQWTATQPLALVDFEDAAAFRNANTLAELHQLSA